MIPPGYYWVKRQKDSAWDIAELRVNQTRTDGGVISSLYWDGWHSDILDLQDVEVIGARITPPGSGEGMSHNRKTKGEELRCHCGGGYAAVHAAHGKWVLGACVVCGGAPPSHVPKGKTLLEVFGDEKPLEVGYGDPL
jgi:hypothetical protein